MNAPSPLNAKPGCRCWQALGPGLWLCSSILVSADTWVTFQVDMAQQINVGAYKVGSSSVFVRGVFNGWGTDTAMTNAPSVLLGMNADKEVAREPLDPQKVHQEIDGTSSKSAMTSARTCAAPRALS